MSSTEKKIELLAPGGDLDGIKAAIAAGADAVYCGLDRFNARNRAKNIPLSDFPGIVRLAHENQCEIFLTLNILIVESEFPTLFRLLNRIVNMGVDGLIVQDLGLLSLLCRFFPTLAVHASTQLTSHNAGQIQFLADLGAKRVNLCRELNVAEIEELTDEAHGHGLLSEVFVHGSLCLSFSGLCYLSSFQSGNSGNRGRCSQPCRNPYEVSPSGIGHPLNLKDNSAFCDLADLAAAGVDSVKIEGRIKKFHYVYTVVRAFRKQLQRLQEKQPLRLDRGELRKVFNRDFSNGYLRGDLGGDMFIDNPRDHSALYLVQSQGAGTTTQNIEAAKGQIYELRTEIIGDVQEKIQGLNVDKIPLLLHISGRCGSVLLITVTGPGLEFVLRSDVLLADSKNPGFCLTGEQLFKALSAIDDSGYRLEELEMKDLCPGLFLPHRELNRIREKLLFVLNDARVSLPSVDLPRLLRHKQVAAPILSVLIDSADDVEMLRETEVDCYLQLPSQLGTEYSRLLELCRRNRQISPCFPPILIGDEYGTALEFLAELQPEKIVTDNSGMAQAASVSGIPWIAGPCLNSVNSWSLRCLQEKSHCCGAFISNELSRVQIKAIRRPENFPLYYSIFHPVQLMTSRLCLLQGVVGCHKERMDGDCLRGCEKSSVIRSDNNDPLLLKKSKGNYHGLYVASHTLNTVIVEEIPDLFHSFFIDLRAIHTHTECTVESAELIALFTSLLRGEDGATEALHNTIRPTTNRQYGKGI